MLGQYSFNAINLKTQGSDMATATDTIETFHGHGDREASMWFTESTYILFALGLSKNEVKKQIIFSLRGKAKTALAFCGKSPENLRLKDIEILLRQHFPSKKSQEERLRKLIEMEKLESLKGIEEVINQADIIHRVDGRSQKIK